MRKTGQLWIVFSIIAALLLLSCTNPNLGRPPEENQKAIETSQDTEGESVGSAEIASIDEDFTLDSMGNNPVLVPDTTDNINDVSVAVDDLIWRQLNLAYEYYTMGLMANRETAWEEAQYYFEKSIMILGELDIDTEADSLSYEAAKYNQLLAELVTSYRQTLLSLGHLPSDVSPDALMSRFSEVNHLKVDSTEFQRLEEYAQEKVSYNVPIIMNERVKNCILYYQTVARDAFAKHLSRSTKYLPLFKKVFAEYGIPTDMVYLASVESGYSPHAYSWARAMGLWQFIASTGRMYKLDRNWWYDERKDQIKSTHAAAQFLKDLYDKFGSWELAMAAYNGGPGRVSRTIKKQKTRDFWKLKLRKQTMDYVPFFMAATIISKNPEKFGFTDIQYQSEWSYDEVTINKCLDLKVIAREIGCTYKELKELNPELLRTFTPPAEKNYKLRVPEGKRAIFLAAYDDMPSSQETSFVKHKIRKGETVSTIARRYGVSQFAIFGANNINRRSKIYAGKMLIVPVPNDRNYPEKKKHDYKSDGNAYYVRSGDTVWDIARAFGTTPEKIRRLNHLDRRARIYVGQEIKIFDTGSKSTVSKKAETKSKSSDSGKSKKYVVKNGDTLWDIAVKFKTSVSALRRANNLGRRSRIYPGTTLTIPGSGSSRDYSIHTIRKGDTLWEIAMDYNTTVSKLLAWNDLTNRNRIRVGDKIKIYNE